MSTPSSVSASGSVTMGPVIEVKAATPPAETKSVSKANLSRLCVDIDGTVGESFIPQLANQYPQYRLYHQTVVNLGILVPYGEESGCTVFASALMLGVIKLLHTHGYPIDVLTQAAYSENILKILDIADCVNIYANRTWRFTKERKFEGMPITLKNKGEVAKQLYTEEGIQDAQCFLIDDDEKQRANFAAQTNVDAKNSEKKWGTICADFFSNWKAMPSGKIIQFNSRNECHRLMRFDQITQFDCMIKAFIDPEYGDKTVCRNLTAALYAEPQWLSHGNARIDSDWHTLRSKVDTLNYRMFSVELNALILDVFKMYLGHAKLRPEEIDRKQEDIEEQKTLAVWQTRVGLLKKNILKINTLIASNPFIRRIIRAMDLLSEYENTRPDEAYCEFYACCGSREVLTAIENAKLILKTELPKIWQDFAETLHLLSTWNDSLSENTWEAKLKELLEKYTSLKSGLTSLQENPQLSALTTRQPSCWSILLSCFSFFQSCAPNMETPATVLKMIGDNVDDFFTAAMSSMSEKYAKMRSADAAGLCLEIESKAVEASEPLAPTANPNLASPPPAIEMSV
ncbi:MAG: hypothetical protein M1561_07940 [Gammaproteobacteria bacterium]|nr:hypothetical protein [Gammaproteobacteria bacterium]